MLAELLGNEAEALGLAALISLSMARSAARGSSAEYIPLEEQDTELWDASLIAQGERYLAYRRAISLTTEPGLRGYLERRRSALSGAAGRPGPG